MFLPLNLHRVTMFSVFFNFAYWCVLNYSTSRHVGKKPLPQSNVEKKKVNRRSEKDPIIALRLQNSFSLQHWIGVRVFACCKKLPQKRGAIIEPIPVRNFEKKMPITSLYQTTSVGVLMLPTPQDFRFIITVSAKVPDCLLR